MRTRTLVTGLAALATVAAPFASPASASPAAVVLLFCGFTSADLTPGTQTGEIDGGPVVGYDYGVPPAAEIAEVTITCSIQVNGHYHSDPDAVRASAEGRGVAYLPPTPISYQATPEDSVTLCTEIRVVTSAADVTWYFDENSGEWATDPSTTRCDSSYTDPPPPQEICDVVQPVCDLTAPEP